MSTSSKRVLITGGAGFLGSHLSDRFLAAGWSVICVDNFQTGSLENIRHFEKNPAFQLIKHDVVQPLDLEVDLILNFACPASPVHYQADPVRTWKTSVLGAMHLLELARRNNARIVHASTSEVYGDPEEHPQKETYWGRVNPIGIRSCYDEGKRAAETLCFDYQRCYGVDVGVIRIFNTYGPRMAADDGRVVSNFVVQALKGEDLTLYGDGSQTRSFCFCDDLVTGIMKMALKKGFTGPVNLGNDAEFTVKELAEKVIELTASGSKLVYLPLPSDDPRQRRPDLSVARKELGFATTVPLEEGIKRTIGYFRALLES